MSLPIMIDLKRYGRRALMADLIAGITVVAVLIPQGMAYALLAGLPPIYGLYGALVPMIIYAFFASSRFLSIGPVALMSIIVLSSLSIFAEPGSQQYLDMVFMTALIAGILQLGYGLFKLGFLSSFLSRPVMNGFISAAGVIIAISQIKYLLGIELPRNLSIIGMVRDVINNISEFNSLSALLGLSAMVLILVFKRISRKIPGAIIVVIIGSLLMYMLQTYNSGVAIVGEMPVGLPVFYAGFFQWEYLSTLLPAALIVSLICFIGSYSIGKTLAEKHEAHRIDANQELIGLGLAKIVGSFFQAMPSTGSFTRSSINYSAGARTSLSAIFSAILLSLILVFFSTLFYYLPEPILAAIVITSVFSLIDYKEGFFLYKVDRSDFWVLITTFSATLIFGIVNGIIAGIILSLITVLMKSSKTDYAVLGNLEGTNDFRNIKRFTKAKPVKGIVILRFSQPLFFANAEEFYNTVIKEAHNAENTRAIIISFPTYQVPDATATYKLTDLISYCKKHNWRLILTDLNGPVRDFMHSSGIYRLMGTDNFFLSVNDAVLSIRRGDSGLDLSNKYSGQSNVRTRSTKILGPPKKHKNVKR